MYVVGLVSAPCAACGRVAALQPGPSHAAQRRRTDRPGLAFRPACFPDRFDFRKGRLDTALAELAGGRNLSLCLTPTLIACPVGQKPRRTVSQALARNGAQPR
jgi:hypothetical protein